MNMALIARHLIDFGGTANVAPWARRSVMRRVFDCVRPVGDNFARRCARAPCCIQMTCVRAPSQSFRCHDNFRGAMPNVCRGVGTCRRDQFARRAFELR